MNIIIDASNLQRGGGLVHLKNLLNFADNKKYGFKKIIVYGGRNTLEKLPTKIFLELREISVLNKTFFHRFIWQQTQLERLAELEKSLLFIPGGLYLGKHRAENRQILEVRSAIALSDQYVGLFLAESGPHQYPVWCRIKIDPSV